MRSARRAVIGNYPEKVSAELCGLHLEDAGIAYWVVPERGHWQLQVDRDDAMMARLVAHGGGVWAEDDETPRPGGRRSAVAWLVVAALVASLAVVVLRFV